MAPVWPGADPDRPSAARMYDYLLGGSYNFAVDRDLVRRVMALLPELPLMAQEHRAFLRRAVRHLVGAGVRQFIDLGSGIPTAGTVHDVAQALAPDARVVYVDHDPVAVSRSRDVLAGNRRVAIVQEDLRHPDRVLTHPDTRALLHLDQPVALLLVATLHFMADADEPARIIARFADGVAAGSFLVLSHATPLPGSAAADAARSGMVPHPMRVRPPERVASFFAAFPLVPPGLVEVSRWRPEPRAGEPGPGNGDPARVFSGLAGIGRKPARTCRG